MVFAALTWGFFGADANLHTWDTANAISGLVFPLNTGAHQRWLELLPIDVLDLVLSVLRRSPVSRIAFLLLTTSRIVPGGLKHDCDLL